MSVDHYENFPVASLLVPARLRQPIEVIYRFARSADDIADEGDATPEERWPGWPPTRRTGPHRRRHAAADTAVRRWPRSSPRHALPLQLFRDLLDAFAQDVVKKRYADYPELLDYCRRSANPVGRLVLHLFGRTEPEHLSSPTASAPPAADQLLAGRGGRLAKGPRLHPADRSFPHFKVGEADIAQRPLVGQLGGADGFRDRPGDCPDAAAAPRWSMPCPAASAGKSA
jgi:phytoene/squalene synthetase